MFLPKLLSICRISAKKNTPVKIITTKQNSIYLNIALEQYIFEKGEVKVPTLFIWRNNPTIVIGRHQNPWKQCRIQEMKRDNITVSRRKSGGGAVYQDLGNTCFSFFTPYKKDEQYDYRSANNQIIIDALNKLGIKGEVSGRNDLVVDGKKFSGSAYRLTLGNKDGVGRKALHHGTIMFSVDFQALQKYLNPNKKKLQSKGIDSVISRVINLQQLDPSVNHQKFVPLLEQSFIEYHGNNQVTKEQISLQSTSQGSKIIQQNYERLKSWDWIFGQCPSFKYSIQKKFQWGLVEITFQVQNACIQKCKIYSDCLYPEFITQINQLILKLKYDSEGIQFYRQKLLKQFPENPTFQQMSNQLCDWIISEL